MNSKSFIIPKSSPKKLPQGIDTKSHSFVSDPKETLCSPKSFLQKSFHRLNAVSPSSRHFKRLSEEIASPHEPQVDERSNNRMKSIYSKIKVVVTLSDPFRPNKELSTRPEALKKPDILRASFTQNKSNYLEVEVPSPTLSSSSHKKPKNTLYPLLGVNQLEEPIGRRIFQSEGRTSPFKKNASGAEALNSEQSNSHSNVVIKKADQDPLARSKYWKNISLNNQHSQKSSLVKLQEPSDNALTRIIRRKSCHCNDCGGISTLEKRHMNIVIPIKRTEERIELSLKILERFNTSKTEHLESAVKTPKQSFPKRRDGRIQNGNDFPKPSSAKSNMLEIKTFSLAVSHLEEAKARKSRNFNDELKNDSIALNDTKTPKSNDKQTPKSDRKRSIRLSQKVCSLNIEDKFQARPSHSKEGPFSIKQCDPERIHSSSDSQSEMSMSELDSPLSSQIKGSRYTIRKSWQNKDLISPNKIEEVPSSVESPEIRPMNRSSIKNYTKSKTMNFPRINKQANVKTHGNLKDAIETNYTDRELNIDFKEEKEFAPVKNFLINESAIHNAQSPGRGLISQLIKSPRNLRVKVPEKTRSNKQTQPYSSYYSTKNDFSSLGSKKQLNGIYSDTYLSNSMSFKQIKPQQSAKDISLLNVSKQTKLPQFPKNASLFDLNKPLEVEKMTPKATSGVRIKLGRITITTSLLNNRESRPNDYGVIHEKGELRTDVDQSPRKKKKSPLKMREKNKNFEALSLNKIIGAYDSAHTSLVTKK